MLTVNYTNAVTSDVFACISVNPWSTRRIVTRKLWNSYTWKSVCWRTELSKFWEKIPCDWFHMAILYNQCNFQSKWNFTSHCKIPFKNVLDPRLWVLLSISFPQIFIFILPVVPTIRISKCYWACTACTCSVSSLFWPACSKNCQIKKES